MEKKKREKKKGKQPNLYCCQPLMCTIMVITAFGKLQFVFVVVYSHIQSLSPQLL